MAILRRFTRIVYFLNTTLTERDYNRFGIKILKKDFDLLFVDFTKYLYPLVKKDTYKQKNNIGYKYIKIINKYDTDDLFHNLKITDHIILLFHYNDKTFHIYKAISKYKIAYSIFMMNAVPVSPRSRRRKSNYLLILNKIRKHFGYKLVTKMLFKLSSNKNIAKYVHGIRPPTFCLLGGGMSKYLYSSSYALRNNKTEDLMLHTLDYDIYLSIKNINSSVMNNGKYAVFIDQPGPLFLADNLTVNRTKSALTAEKYFPSITRFFTYIEAKYNLTIIIAGHPDSKHETISEHYGNRRVIYGKIGELIKDSEFVITKGSTAICFAVLFSKPIIFYTTEEYEKFTEAKELILSNCSYFNKTPINIDNNYNNINYEMELSIDQKMYDNYKNLFIKSPGTIDEISWIVLKEKLLKLNTNYAT